MKKIIVAFTLALCFSMTSVFAAPSVTNDVKSASENAKVSTVDTAALTSSTNETAKKAATQIETVNADATKLVTSITASEVTGAADFDWAKAQLLSNIFELTVTEGANTNVTVTLEVPNLTSGLGDVRVLHFSTVRNTWELITPDAVDYNNKTVKTTFKDLSPVAVVYAPTSGSKTTDTKTGDTTNVVPYICLAGIAGLAVIVLFKKKAAHN